MKNIPFLSLAAFFLISCSKPVDDPPPDPPVDTAPYFPPNGTNTWEGRSAVSLGWNEPEMNNLFTWLQGKNTKSFIILHNGRLVTEKYFGSFTVDSTWYWASAGKTLTAFLVGLAQQEGWLQIQHPTSQYLGTGWTSLPVAKENLITIRHQLTMTSGLDDGVGDPDCTDPPCLVYKADAGHRWAYHNAAYTLLYKVVENATGQSYNAYFNSRLRSLIGMNGLWINTGFLNVYYSNTRSMARFGLLMLNRGKWDQQTIMGDANYYQAMINSSQALNPSYGYLWWLNGKSPHMLPQSQFVFNSSLVPNAPADLYAALGKNDQKLYVVPSLKLVVVRMGESAGNPNLALSSFDNELWGKLKTIIGY
jgi:CubicO group peptidase (beta-lactamase class C family)